LVRRSGTAGDHVTLIPFPGDPGQVLQRLVATLRSIGYPTRVEELPQSAYFGQSQPRAFLQAEAGTTGWIADYVSASDFFVPLVQCGQAGAVNYGRFCDPRLDARISRALADQSRQAGVASREWSEIDRVVVDDAVDAPLSNPLEPDFVARRVGNFEYNPQWGVLVDQLWVR
jgi:peptide/nickel transport system substrate-binding protein